MLNRRTLIVAGGLAVPLMLAPERADAQARATTRDDGPLTVLLEAIAPFSFQDAEGKPVGYAVELMQELLRRCKLAARLEFNSWASIYQRAQTQPRVLVADMTRLAEREKLFYWIGPTATRRLFLYRLKSRPEVQPLTLEGAKAFKTAVIRDDASERDLLARGFELGRHLDRSPDYAALLRKLFARRDELMAMNSTVAAATLHRYGYDLKQIEPVVKVSDSHAFMALSLNSGAALCARLSRGWETMRHNGTVATIAARYPSVALD